MLIEKFKGQCDAFRFKLDVKYKHKRNNRCIKDGLVSLDFASLKFENA